jgi:hypothetical protein
MLEFDTDIIRKNKIELLDCQVDLILKSLEMYGYMYQFIYPRSSKTLTNEENLRISLVRDTFEQILSEYNESKNNNKIQNNTNRNKIKVNYKKIKNFA